MKASVIACACVLAAIGISCDLTSTSPTSRDDQGSATQSGPIGRNGQVRPEPELPNTERTSLCELSGVGVGESSCGVYEALKIDKYSQYCIGLISADEYIDFLGVLEGERRRGCYLTADGAICDLRSTGSCPR